MKAPLDMKAGTFYDVEDGFVLPIIDLPFKTEIRLHTKLSATCMFDIHLINVNNQHAGFFFTTRFEVRNEGGYLITWLHNKGPAVEAEQLIRTENLVLYNYPNRGSLAISPKVNPQIETIFEEQ